MQATVNRYNGVSEVAIEIKYLAVGDLFRHHGSQQWLRVTGDPTLNEDGSWDVEANPSAFLVG